MLKADCNFEFSNEFEVDVKFQEPKVSINEKEQIELSKSKIDAGLSTVRRELQVLNPNVKDIDALIKEIEEEKSNKNKSMVDDVERNPAKAPHQHEGTGMDVVDPEDETKHYHMMSDGSGRTTSDPYGANHVHDGPDGQTVM